MQIHYAKELFNLADFRKYSDTFIETGTCAGDGVQRAVDAGFFFIKSVELSEDYFNQSIKRFGIPHGSNKQMIFRGDTVRIYRNDWGTFFHPHSFVLDLYLGDSTKQLPRILDAQDGPSVVFLDAHPAGPGTAGHDDLMEKGAKSEFQQDRIITKELEILFSPTCFKYNVIMIDDMNGHNAESQKYIDFIHEHSPSYLFYFYDQKLGNKIYPQKILVCIP